MGKLGRRINELATAKVPFTLLVGGERVKMFFDFKLPTGALFESWAYAKKYLLARKEEAAAEGRELPVEDEQEILGQGRIRWYAAAGFRDADGELVWDNPEEIPDTSIMPLQMFIMPNVLGIRLTDDKDENEEDNLKK
ncbi:hypothetical protein M0R72_06210 [Candidatus Pacearchaeota archaeon]|jgi:hypothetical protein|nr:hypothetical protein [Candidatus Pacearchaeota archaeon]